LYTRRREHIAKRNHALCNEINVCVNCSKICINNKFIQVIKWAEEYEEIEYARSGFVTSESLELPEGSLPQFDHSMEPQLRRLGMPTSLQKGIITLIKPFKVCQKGDVLTPEQAQILVHILYSLDKSKIFMLITI
jgi:mRNA turnover protein 4